METIILVIHLILAIGIVVTVLLQRSEGGGLGIGGGGGGGLMSVRSAANLMTRTTAVLAAAFMVTSLTLAILAGMRTERKSILERPATTAPVEQQAPAKPKVPLSQ